MNIAIIGAGFAGLSAAYFFLKEGQKVVLFHEESGASRAACGLMHPYTGRNAFRSHFAEEAFAISSSLFEEAQNYSQKPIILQKGVLRKSVCAPQTQILEEHCQKWGDIERISEEEFFIHKALVISSANYLDGLLQAVCAKGAEVYSQKIHDLTSLQKFDQIVIAAGYGIREFRECQSLKVQFLKGQSLQFLGKAPFEKSFISRGYALTFSDHFEVGATYEREFTDEKADIESAKKLLQEKFYDIELLSSFFASSQASCKSGVRVCSKQGYLPIIQKVADKTYVFTGLGSRGLLYHGLYGIKLVETILSKNKLFL